MARTLHIAFLAVFAAATAEAGELNVSASRSVVGVGEIFYIQVEARGGSMSEPNISASSDFDIEVNSPSISTSRSVQIVNGRVDASLRTTWRYAASALRKGRATLPPITVEIDGKVETSPDIVITAEATAPLRPSPSQSRSASSMQRTTPSDGGDRKQLTVDDIVLLESFVDKTRVYQGERLLLTWKFWLLNAQRFGSTRPDGKPSVEGFYEGGIEESDYVEERDGYEYRVHEWRQPLYATGSGDYTVGPWQWDGTVEFPDPATNRRMQLRRSYRTPPIEVTVMPLPARPGGFSGAVGTFELRSNLSNTSPTQGVPTTLNVRVTGDGNPDAIGEPVLPALEWGYVSDAETQYRAAGDQAQWAVEKTFRYQITPLESGSVTIPPIRFVYFSPEDADYVTLETDALDVYVEPSEENTELVVIGDSTPQENSTVNIIGEDVLAIVNDAGSLSAKGSGVPMNASLLLLPPVAYAGLLVWRRKRRRLEEDSVYARRHFAKSSATKRLRDLSKTADPVAEMHVAVMQYLADALGAARAGITSQDAERMLSERGAPDEVRATFVKVLRACERGRYGGASLKEVEVEALRNAVLNAIDGVERLVPKEGR